MRKTLLPLKLLVDANAWQFWGKTKLYFIFSAHYPVQNNLPAPLQEIPCCQRKRGWKG